MVGSWVNETTEEDLSHLRIRQAHRHLALMWNTQSTMVSSGAIPTVASSCHDSSSPDSRSSDERVRMLEGSGTRVSIEIQLEPSP
jgi:hypothetical protein